jgi:hypothetical protein
MGVPYMSALVLLAFCSAADPSPKDALQPFNLFVGSWKATGYPDGTKEERANGFWQEKISWEWLFKKDDVALVGTVEKGKHFTRLELRYAPDTKLYRLTATAPDKSTQTYAGTLAAGKQKEQILTLDRTDDTGPEAQRLVFTLLHHNRYLYRFETRPAGVKAFARKYQVGATKEGESFADVPTGPECVVSGGLGKIPVSHKGTTYYVCCSGCRDAFKEDPEKYIKEYEARKKK